MQAKLKTFWNMQWQKHFCLQTLGTFIESLVVQTFPPRIYRQVLIRIYINWSSIVLSLDFSVCPILEIFFPSEYSSILSATIPVSKYLYHILWLDIQLSIYFKWSHNLEIMGNITERFLMLFLKKDRILGSSKLLIQKSWF